MAGGAKARGCEAPVWEREWYIRTNAVELVAARDAKIARLRQQITKLNKAVHIHKADCQRLRAGKFTPEELQNLCHNLHEQKPGCTRADFAAGCKEFQDKLFGVDGRIPLSPLAQISGSAWCYYTGLVRRQWAGTKELAQWEEQNKHITSKWSTGPLGCSMYQ